MNKELNSKSKRIKLVLTDVDGVLTDGGMYYTEKGDIMKKFHTRDGMGVTLLRKNNIPTVIVTKEKTTMVKKWSTKMKIKKLYDGINDKESIIDEICKKFDVSTKELAYIGDDINDVGILRKVGFSAVPNDAISETKKIADYICKTNGGHGAFREFADLILASVKKI